MSVAPEYRAQTSFGVRVDGTDGSMNLWDFRNIETARAVRDELTRLVDGLDGRPVEPVKPPAVGVTFHLAGHADPRLFMSGFTVSDWEPPARVSSTRDIGWKVVTDSGVEVHIEIIPSLIAPPG